MSGWSIHHLPYERHLFSIRTIYIDHMFVEALFMVALTLGHDISGPSQREQLEAVLHEIGQIKSATYTVEVPMYAPGEDTPMRTDSFFIREFDNPADTSIGASFGRFTPEKEHLLQWFYDGSVRGKVYWDRKAVRIDDFSDNPHLYRPVWAPFFNYAKSIISYALSTENITVRLLDQDDAFKILVEVPDKVVEFFGGPQEIEAPRSIFPERYSRYELWVAKASNLPFRIKRVMPHNTSERICKNAVLNQERAKNFIPSDYYPADFVLEKFSRRRAEPPSDLVGTRAAQWTLQDADDRPVSLTDIKSKVLLIEFTGIGCGPCQLALPFLNDLATSYPEQDFSLISIETWNSDQGVHGRYRDRNNLKYPFLQSKDSIREDYQVRGVPAFYLLDQDRTIVKVFTGYDKEKTGRLLRDLIEGMLK